MTYFPQSPFNLGQRGWVCPKCGRVYNPHVTECYHCNTPPEKTSTSVELEPNKTSITTMEVSDTTYHTPFN